MAPSATKFGKLRMLYFILLLGLIVRLSILAKCLEFYFQNVIFQRAFSIFAIMASSSQRNKRKKQARGIHMVNDEVQLLLAVSNDLMTIKFQII